MEQEQQIPLDDFNLAERYLLGELAADEAMSFTQRMKEDVALQAVVNELRITITGIRQAAVKARLDEYHTAFNQTRNKKPTTSRIVPVYRWLSAAAILLFIVSVGWWAFLREDKQETLYATFYSKEPGLITAMSSTDNYAFDRAMVDYKTGDYNAAIKAWEVLLKNNPESDTLNYFIGSAWMAQKDEDRAKPYLLKAADKESGYFSADAHWYLGLISVKEGKAEEAINHISKSNHPDKEKLLQQLKAK